MKRNKCLTFIEFFTPVLLLLFFFVLSLFFSTEEQKYKDLYKEDYEFLFKYSSNLTNGVKSSNQIISDIKNVTNSTPIQYKKFLAQCEKHPKVALIGRNFPEKIKNKISEHFWELPNLTDIEKINFFKIYNSVDEFNEYISSENYGTDDINNPKICFGISKSDDKEYGFGIHYDTIDRTKEENMLIMDMPKIPDSKTSKNEKIRIQTDLSSFEFYEYSGYLMVLKIIYDYILQEVTLNPKAEINFSIIEMIYNSILQNKFHKYLYLLGFFVIISFAIILSINIYREIQLRESKKKEYLKCMGIKERVLFLSSFIRSLVINIVHSPLTALIIKFLLTKSKYEYLLIILFLYGLNIFSMTYFFQSFQRKSRKGVIVSLLYYCIMSFLYVPINSPIINKKIINTFCVLFPPINLMFGFDVLITYEKEFNEFNDIKADVGQITILEMILFFFASFFIYLFIGYINSHCFNYCQGICNCCQKKIKRIKAPEKEESKDKDLVSNTDTNSQKINIDNQKFDNELKLGEIYNDESLDNSSFHQIKPGLNKELRMMTHDLFNTPDNASVYHKKIANITTRLKQTKREVPFLDISVDTNHSTNKNFVDELEKNYKMQKERQAIRKMRRELGKTMCNLKNEEFFVNNVDVSVIHEVIPSDIVSVKDIESVVSDNTNSNLDNLQKGEFNKKKDEINPGQRLEVKKLEKYYNNGKKVVLDELNCTMYENEIFALLGENGAGKSTFISIIGGLIEANGGSIRYKKDQDDKGYNILDKNGNNKFRKILGICPQNNKILFNDLTVQENLEIFCLLKYRKIEKENSKNMFNSITEEVNYLLKKFDLNDDRTKNCFAKDLSGGQKRKLCIAIACCGKSQVIILDEPTGGIDVVSRKNIWKILKNLKLEEKIIILISHSMEEVSNLADKIGILEKGKFILQGTSRELIDDYGQYFSLIINQKIDYEKAKEISSYISRNYYIEKEIPINNISEKSTQKSNSTLISINEKRIKLEVFKERAVIKISNKYFKKNKTAQLFNYLKERHQITNFLIIEDQLEDIFVNIINNSKNKTNRDILTSNKNKYLVISSSNTQKTSLRFFPKLLNELKVSFFKNLKGIRGIISDILFPLILILIACLVSYIEFLEENKSSDIYLINLNDEYQNIYAENLVKDDGNYSYYLIHNIVEEEKHKLENYDFNFIDHSEENITDLTLTQKILFFMKIIDDNKKSGKFTINYADYLFTKFNDFEHKYEFISFIDTKRKHYPIFFANYLLNCIIKYGIKKTNEYNHYYSYDKVVSEILVSNSPYPLKYEEKNNKKIRNGFSLVFFTSIAFSLIPSNIIMSIIKEKENKLKHLQILSGLSLLTYWLNNYIFELLKYAVISIFSYIILIIFNFEEKYLIVLYILYGPAMISFTYCISYFIEKEGQGQTIALLINLLFGTLGSSAILILRTNEDAKNIGKILSIFFRIIPSFCMSYGYNELISKNSLYVIDNHIDEINNQDYIVNYIKDDIIFLIIEIIVYTGILIILENKDYLLWKYFRKCNKTSNKKREKIEDKESEKSNQPKKDDIYSKEPINKNKKALPLVSVEKIKKILQFRLNCFKLCKKKMKLILDDLSFDVENGECFGLIGTNGAGKTTCFRCLCKEIKPDSGIIKINDSNIFDYTSYQKPSIGYCPQFDAIFEYLTVEENIFFFGRLKGFNQDNLGKLAKSIMECLDLYQFRNVRCKNLSGGNKRKLSVGISILAKPDVIFLDEPSTGMDPYTRRLLLNILNYGYLKNNDNGINKNEQKKGIILTTHSLEEIEALCDRIGILIDGKMDRERIGTINQIVNKKKRYIALNVEFKKPNTKEITKNYEKICEDRIMNKKEIENFLNFLKKSDYSKYIKKKSLGRDLLFLLETNKSINKYTILIWVKYMDYLQKLIQKLKENHFDKIICVSFNMNNFILKIRNNYKENESDSYIYGVLEANKESLFIEEYSYTLTTLGKIFFDFCQEAYQNEPNIQDPFIIESESNSPLKVEL